MGVGVVGSCEIDLVDIAEDVCEMQTGEGLSFEGESVEGVKGGSEVAFYETLVFVYLGKLHHSGLFYYPPPSPSPTTHAGYCD